MDRDLRIGDLVIIKKELQEIVGIKHIGIIIAEARIIPSEVIDCDIEEIDSFNIYFADLDTLYTIPKGCVEKVPDM